MDQTTRRGALAGLRVIDATTGRAGPLVGMLLADAGADVVKVAAATSPVWDRGKRAGERAEEELLLSADVLITRTADEVTTPDNPRLVHLVVPPYLDGAAWPLTIESEGMLAAMTGVALRQTSAAGGPIDSVIPVLPVVHGIWATAAVLAALVERERSGRGQVVTVGGVHAAMVASSAALNFDPAVAPAARIGGPGGSVPFYRTYRCGDGEWLFLAALTPRFTDMAFTALDLHDLYDDPRLEGRGRAAMLRPDNSPWVTERIAEVFQSVTRQEWLDRLHDAGCPSGPVLGRDDWLDHPQLDAIGMRVEVDDPERGRVVMPGVPLVLHATPSAVRGAAPPAPTGPPAMWASPPWELVPSEGPAVEGTARGPLDGVTVLDLGAIIAGPFAGSLLGELGADVVKVEPLGGDSFRGPGFAAYNKGQRGLAIDLQNPRGRDALLALVRTADIVIDNYRPGVLGRLRLEWQDLREVNPGVVSVSITGFGEGGPLGSEAGFDPVLQAMSGMMSAQGGDDEPMFFTVPVNDVAAAATTAVGALLAHLHRLRNGVGQQVTTSLAAMSALLQADELVRHDGRNPAPVGGRDHRGRSVGDRYYEADDGWLRLLGASEAELRAALGTDDVAGWVAGRSRAEAVNDLLAEGIAAVPARAARELADDSDVLRHDVLRPDTRPGRDGCWTTGIYAGFSRTPLAGSGPAPALGEHTDELLAEAGCSPAEIDDLRQLGVIPPTD